MPQYQVSISKNFSNEDRSLRKINMQNKNILYCDKEEWDEEKDNLFWKEVRKLNPKESDTFYFENIIFPSLLPHIKKYSFTPLKFSQENYILEEDYLFWQKGQKKSFVNLAQFTNCTFENFNFCYIKAQTINLTNCTIKGNVLFSTNYIENIFISESPNIKSLEIRINNFRSLELIECDIEELKLKDLEVNSIKLLTLNIKEITFNSLSIKAGLFQDLNIQTVRSNAPFFLDNINKFFYNNVYIKNADREYFRFMKKFFSEKEDFINVNEMYKLEMESYFKELWKKIWNILVDPCQSNKIILRDNRKKENIIILFQNFLVVLFSKCASNFGESWTRPLFCLLTVSFLNVFFTSDCSLSYLFSDSNKLWTKIFKSIYFLDKETLTATRGFFNIFQGLLIYQLIVSIKRKIKF